MNFIQKTQRLLQRTSRRVYVHFNDRYRDLKYKALGRMGRQKEVVTLVIDKSSHQ